jgi:hypothetical protein
MSSLPEPLKISCVDSKCDADLHCFRPTRGMTEDERGRCRNCGADQVDWETLHRRDLAHMDALFAELPKELIRHHYWHMPIPERIAGKAQRVRPEVVAERTRAAIHSRVGPPSSELFRDGTQTPNEHGSDAQIYYLGMHAVAACCRKCMEYWHGIPREQRLAPVQEQYFAALVWAYVCQRMGWPEHDGLVAP